MPTTDHEKEDKDQEGRGQVKAIVIGDFNRVVGEGSTGKVVGLFGFGRRNEKGKIFTSFCRQYDLAVMSTWLREIKTELHTWKSGKANKLIKFL